MLFKEVIGQKEIKDFLLQNKHSNRTAHSMLFVGDEGVGKLQIALALAQYFCCQNPAENDSCGECPSCKKMSKLSHPDVHFIFPTISNSKKPISIYFTKEWQELFAENNYFTFAEWLNKMGAGNSQAIINNKESEDLVKKLSLKPYESKYRVIIIWKAEKMNIEAANKLLKIIEEPPENTLFLLTTDKIDLILPTIISRTQIIRVPKIKNESIVRHLKELGILKEQEMSNILKIADGSYTNVLNLIKENEVDNENFELFVKFMRMCYTKKYLEINEVVDEISKLGREKQKKLLEYSLKMIRNNFAMNIFDNSEDADKINYLNSKEVEFSQKFFPFINENNIVEISDELNKAYYHIERNAQARFVFLDIAIKFFDLLRK